MVEVQRLDNEGMDSEEDKATDEDGARSDSEEAPDGTVCVSLPWRGNAHGGDERRRLGRHLLCCEHPANHDN
jgi:hypothetical protein